MKKITFLLLCLASFCFVNAQTTIVGWTFDGGLNSNLGQTGVALTSPGTGMAPFASGVGCGQEAIANSWSAGDAWQTASFNASGFTSVNVSADQSSFNNGPTGPFQIQFRINSGAWENLGATYSINIESGCNKITTSRTLPATANNQSDIQIRWLSNGGGSTGAGSRIDNILVQGTSVGCTNPTVPTVTATPSTVCPGEMSTLNISGMLNDATQWHIYTGSCGGTQIGTTAGTTFNVNPSVTTTYFVRG